MLDADSRRESLHRRLDNTRDALDSIRRRKEALATSAQDLLVRADELVAYARQALDDRWAATEKFPEPGRSLVRGIACDNFLRLLQELSTTLLPALRGANSTRIPIELEAVLVEAAADAAGGPLAVVVYANASYNYSIQYYGDPLTDLAKLIAPFAPPPASSSSRFLFLSLPELERDSATLHAVMLGHEVGHLRDWVHGITAPLNVPLPASWLAADGSPKAEYLEVVPFFRSLVANWAQELVSDVYAALVLGPASLLSLLELLVNVTEVTADSRTHPAGDRRISVVLTVLDGLGAGAITELVPVLAPLRQLGTASSSRPVRIQGYTDRGRQMQEAADEAWKWLQTSMAGIEASCASTLGSQFEFSSWPDVEWAASELDRGQPCGERARTSLAGPGLDPISAATIINGAWLSRLRRHPGLASVLGTDGSAAAIAQLHAVVDGLVLKSLEVSAVRSGQAWA